MTSDFDKYAVYTHAVQSPAHDAKFLRTVYRDIREAEPVVLREDFCGTHALACAWVKLGTDMRAIGIDIDPEPLQYGRENHQGVLTGQQRDRLTIMQGDVLTTRLPKADIVCAFNFSYFCFHSREALRAYFKGVKRTLSPSGIFVLDIFGGPQHGEPCVDTKRLAGLRYFFEQEFFDPISNRTRFHLHFHPRGSRIRRRVFSYDWRMWSIPEVRDALADAGFSKSAVYWEGTGRNGRGSGRYHKREKGEACRVWTAYIIGLP